MTKPEKFLEELNFEDLEGRRLIIAAMWAPCEVERRCNLYRKYGITIGKKCFIDFGVWIEPGVPSSVVIEDYVVISHGAKIIGHDSSLNNMLDFPIVAKKTILRNNCYIGTGAIVLPGIEIGENSIVGAGSIVTKNVRPNMVVAGNPAREIKTLKKFLNSSLRNYCNNKNDYLEHDSEYRPPAESLPDFCRLLKFERE